MATVPNSYLLRNSEAAAGVLLEGTRSLADAARKRAGQLPTGKEIAIFEGDAKETIQEGVTRVNSLVAAGRGEYVYVTCHAVLHELFDRGSADFDPIGFFATTLQDYTTSTWLTYREPGVPDKWPNVVMVQAACLTRFRRSCSNSGSTIRSDHSTGWNSGRSLSPVSSSALRRSRSSILRFCSAANDAARSTIDQILAALEPGVRRANWCRENGFQGLLGLENLTDLLQ